MDELDAQIERYYAFSLGSISVITFSLLHFGVSFPFSLAYLLPLSYNGNAGGQRGSRHPHTLERG